MRNMFCLVALVALPQLTIFCGNVNAFMESESFELLQSYNLLQTFAFAGNKESNAAKTLDQMMSPVVVYPSISYAEGGAKRYLLTSEPHSSSRKKIRHDQSSPFKSNISKFLDLFTPEGLNKEFKMTKSAMNGNATTDLKKKMAIVCYDLKELHSNGFV